MSAADAVAADRALAEPAAPPPLTTGVRAAYGMGSLAIGISGTLLSGSVLQIYFNQVIGLPAAWVGAALMITLMVDAVTDPLIGRYSDGLRSRFGRRHTLMYAAALPSALGVLAMWHAPAGLGPYGLLAFVVGMVLFVRIATSFFEIPSRALAPELAPGYDDRTKLLAWRFMFAVAGAAAINAILYQVFLREDAANPLGVLNRDRYAEFGVLAAILMFVVIMGSAMATHSRIRHFHVPPAERTSLRKALAELRSSLGQRDLVNLLVATMLNGFGGGIHYGLVAYVALNFWQLKPQEFSFVLMAAPAASLVALWAAPQLSARFGKRPFMMLCYLAWLTCFVTPFIGRYLGVTPANGSDGLLPTLVVLEFFAMIFALGVHIVLQSMLTDAADNVAVKTGRRTEGVLFATYGLLDKWGQGLGALAAGLILTVVAFPARAVPGTVDRDIVVNLVLWAIPSIAACNMLAMVLISRFRIDRGQHEANIAELRRREVARAEA